MAVSIMILNGENTIGLQVLRSIQKYYKIYVGSASRYARCRLSIHTQGFLQHSDFEESETINQITEFIKKNKIEVLIPVFHNSFYFVIKNQKILKRYCNLIPLPSLQTYHILNDKKQLMNQARKYYIRIPDCTGPRPFIIKPRSSCGGSGVRLSDEPTIDRLYVCQKYIEGKQFAIHYIVHNGAIINSIVGIPIIEYSRFGVAVRIMSVNDQKFKKTFEMGANFLTSIDFEGITSLTFIEKEGTHYLIEANPRFWSDLFTYTLSDVNMPRIMIELALGNIPKNTKMRPAVYNNIIPYLIYCIKNLSIPQFGRTDFNLTDPLPHICQLFFLPLRLLKREPYWYL